MTLGEPDVSVQRELLAMNCSLAQHREAYEVFTMRCQEFDYEAAGDAQLAVTTHLDAAMDAFMRACWAQQRSTKGA